MRHLIPTLSLAALVAAGCNAARPTESPNANANATASVTECTGCHGDATAEAPAGGVDLGKSDPRIAPPKDLLGNADTNFRGVGAHQAHLRVGKLTSAPVACGTCHLVPEAVDSPGHVDGKWPAKVVFSGMALKNGATPSKLVPRDATGDAALVEVSCSATYCHGATLKGGHANTPVWNATSDEQRASYTKCDACHGFPPPAPHPASDKCSGCHDTVNDDNVSFAKPEQHINGEINRKSTSCHGCHGSADSDAPPVDTHGKSATTEITVGAHQRHVKVPSGISQVLDCSECHPKPTAVDSPGHADGKIDLAFGARANANGVTSAFSVTPDGTSASCTTYCHGATLHGGTATQPKWNQVDGSQRHCDSCHGNPPPAPHPAATQFECANCHLESTNPDGTLIPSKHIDGVLQAHTCHDCHGDATSPAPPGAHQSHLNAAHHLTAAIACTECHPAPGHRGHSDSTAVQFEFGALANAGGITTDYDETNHTCATYCHGASIGATTPPNWASPVDGSQVACGKCHGISPQTGRHPSVAGSPHAGVGKNCTICHGDVANSTGTGIANTTLHINGTKDVQLPSGMTWDAANKTCSGGCHGSETVHWIGGGN